MKRTKKPHPLFGTVTRFISKKKQRWLRQRRFEEQQGYDSTTSKSKSPKPKKVKESNFVRFMNKLEHKGPQKPGALHEKWTMNIREIMTSRGTWPTGMTDWNVDTLAEYLQELQRQFWNSVPKIIKDEMLQHYCRTTPINFSYDLNCIIRSKKIKISEEQEFRSRISNCLRTFEKIHEIIRKRGLRDKSYIMMKWKRRRSLTRVYLDSYPSPLNQMSEWIKRNIWFCTETTIMCNDYVKLHPILIMPHVIKRVDTSKSPPVGQHLRVNGNVFVF